MHLTLDQGRLQAAGGIDDSKYTSSSTPAEKSARQCRLPHEGLSASTPRASLSLLCQLVGEKTISGARLLIHSAPKTQINKEAHHTRRNRADNI
jgi:hypothetical protein